MITAVSYDEILHRVTYSFEKRRESISEDSKKLVGIIFARANSPLAKSDILPQLNDWHFRSGPNIDFFFAGYTSPNCPGSEYIPVEIPGKSDWFYSSRAFDLLRRKIEAKTQWEYSGGCDLLLINAEYDKANQTSILNFETAVLCRLELMKNDNAIFSVAHFFEKVFRFAESSNSDDPTSKFSDRMGTRVGGSAIISMLNTLVPGDIEHAFKRVGHFATNNITK